MAQGTAVIYVVIQPNMPAFTLGTTHVCGASTHLTLSSLMDFCRETWKKQNIIARCAVYHVRQSKHFQLSRRSLTVASCQTLCFISHLTHDSYSSTEPQTPCRGITFLLVWSGGVEGGEKRHLCIQTLFAGIWDSP